MRSSAFRSVVVRLLSAGMRTIFLLAVMSGFAAGQGHAERKLRPVRSQTELDAVLEKDVSFGFEGTPLEDALEFIEQLAGAPIRLDRSVTAPDSRLVTLNVAKVRLRDALFWILEPELGCVLQDGTIVVATWDTVRRLTPRVRREYDVGDILGPDADARLRRELINLIKSVTGAQRWLYRDLSPDGPERAIRETGRRPEEWIGYEGGRRLVVEQGEGVQDRIREILASLRRQLPGRDGVVRNAIWPPESAHELRLRKALLEPVGFGFEGTPLRDVVDFLRQLVDRNIVVDEFAIREDDRLVSLSLSDLSLRDALNHILGQDMDYVVLNGVIFISEKRRLPVYEPMTFRIHDVRGVVEEGKDGPDRLIDLLRGFTGPDEWSRVKIGGTGECVRATRLSNNLAASQTMRFWELEDDDGERHEDRQKSFMFFIRPGAMAVVQRRPMHSGVAGALDCIRGWRLSAEGKRVDFPTQQELEALQKRLLREGMYIAPKNQSRPGFGLLKSDAPVSERTRRDLREFEWRLRDEKLRESMDTLVEFSFEDTPLLDVVDFLRQLTQKKLVLDERSVLADERLVNMAIRRIPLANALDLLLDDDMGWIVKDGAVYISTRQFLWSVAPLELRLYRRPDLLDGSDAYVAAGRLARIVHELTGSQNWIYTASRTTSVDVPFTGHGHGAYYVRRNGDILVNQYVHVHEEIENILSLLEHQRRDPKPVRGKRLTDAETLFSKRVSIAFERTPLREAVESLTQKTGVDIVVDNPIYRRSRPTVTLSIRDAPLYEALSRLAGERYGWFLEHGVVVIASKERIPRLEPTTIRAYDVRGFFPKTGGGRVVFNRAVADRFVDRIRKVTGSAQWKDADEKTDLPNRAMVVYSPGILLVRQTGRVHRVVEKWINTRRSN